MIVTVCGWIFICIISTILLAIFIALMMVLFMLVEDYTSYKLKNLKLVKRYSKDKYLEHKLKCVEFLAYGCGYGREMTLSEIQELLFEQKKNSSEK